MTGIPFAAQVRSAEPVAFQPTREELRRLALKSPGVRSTGNGGVNVRTRVAARRRRSTFLVCDGAHRLPGATIRRADGDRLARMQDAHLAAVGTVVVDGYLGAPGPLRMATRVITESATASLAGMHRHLLFDPVVGDASFVPDLTVVSTPNLSVPGAPDGSIIAVWLDQGVTRVMGSEFFGETKKAATRMWAERVYDLGGLVLHAACIVVPTARGPSTVIVMGPPDSGKSTLVMSDPASVRVVQDDFVAVLPGGQVVAAENGCIEKTWRLNALLQPVLHAAAVLPDTYLENVPQVGGELHFADEHGPRHARAVFPLTAVGGSPEASVPGLRLLVVLDPGDEVAPAVARMDRTQMPGHFLLRERHAGLAERTGRQGNRLAALLESSSAEVVVLNTSVAGRDEPGAVRRGAAPIVTALANGAVTWEPDPEMRCDVAVALPGDLEPDALWPRRRWETLGRLQEYGDRLAALRTDRRAYLSEFVGLDPGIVAAVT